MSSSHPRAIEILLVEDNPADRVITVNALRAAKVLNSLNVVENGVEAMAYLRKEGKYQSAARPDVILLDLNLPLKDGRTVLAEIKADPVLKAIPVIVLSTSAAPRDVADSYREHANSYITKPVNFQQFTEALKTLENYWFEVVTLPPESAHASPEAQVAKPVQTASSQGPMRVLLVEDSPVDRMIALEAFRKTPAGAFKIDAVSALSAAKDVLAKESFDLILTDLGLPDGFGVESLRSIKRFARGVPVVVLTGRDDPLMGPLMLREGAQDYLVKGTLSGDGLVRSARYALERKAVQDQLIQSQRMDAIGQVAGGVAHDFNNLLTVIVGRAELLKHELADPEVLESVEDILAAANRAATLTRQLLTFSKRNCVNLQPVRIERTLGDFTRILRRVLGETVKVEFHFGADTPLVEADNGMLEQIVMNLAINARDAMPSGGKITLKTSGETVSAAEKRSNPSAYPGRFAKLSVQDTGTGIPQEHLSRIFEAFFTTKDVGKGTGLGLATVHSIVQQHRGWIDVTSRVGEGTTFDIYLPEAIQLFAEQAVATAKSDAGPNRPSQLASGETLLYVEDEGLLRNVTRHHLERAGFHVLEATNGIDAERIFREHRDRIRLLLTDIVMPEGVSGVDLAERIRGNKPELPVVFVSGYSADFIKADAVFVPGKNFLAKPYSAHELITIIRSSLGMTS